MSLLQLRTKSEQAKYDDIVGSELSQTAAEPMLYETHPNQAAVEGLADSTGPAQTAGLAEDAEQAENSNTESGPGADVATTSAAPLAPQRFRAITLKQLDHIEQLQQLTEQQRFDMRVVAQVLPFRVNEYVVNELIDWSDIPNDPIFQLTFPQRSMLREDHFDDVATLLKNGAPRAQLNVALARIRKELNPHPAGQLQHNVPMLDGKPLPGLQHKYPETVLFFPAAGQTCHSYCTFCFRWAQFIGDKELKQAATHADSLIGYLARHREVTDLLVTGGDPMVMRTRVLERYLTPLTEPGLEHIQNIRFGSKALTFWPHRFTSDADADDLLRLFERLVAAGKHVAFMAHMNHFHEMQTPACEEAIRRIRNTGAVIRSQAPMMRHINDDAAVWTEMWRRQVAMGIVPYYMFVARDTGAQHYFEVPLVRAQKIFRQASSHVSGLARTARGPSMSAGPGKIEMLGECEIAGERAIMLRFIQARRREWLQRPFFAKWDAEASWLDQLRPLQGDRFFFEDEYNALFS